MSVKYQHGRLRLKWCLVIFGVVVALLSMRHEHNLFADAWGRIMRTDAGQNEQPVVDAIKPEPPVSKCEVEDWTLYSNVECDPNRPDRQRVELHDSPGVEPSEISSSPSVDTHETSSGNATEKALSR
jgi:hypothetical protein